MCDEEVKTALSTSAAPSVEEQVVSLWEVVEGLRQELIELRMDRRKVMLEELARLEEPLVEQGVIAQRTRPPRHRGGD
jgi:hypothetical protein